TDYRRYVTDAMARLIETAPPDRLNAIAGLVELGIHHEQQHQELILMDILNLFSCNPLRPAYRQTGFFPAQEAAPLAWFAHDGGISEIGHRGDGFAYDNEGPRHEVLLRPFRIASRAVTNEEWVAFIEDGGYRRPELWLSDGWATVKAQDW